MGGENGASSNSHRVLEIINNITPNGQPREMDEKIFAAARKRVLSQRGQTQIGPMEQKSPKDSISRLDSNFRPHRRTLMLLINYKSAQLFSSVI